MIFCGKKFNRITNFSHILQITGVTTTILLGVECHVEIIGQPHVHNVPAFGMGPMLENLGAGATVTGTGSTMNVLEERQANSCHGY